MITRIWSTFSAFRRQCPYGFSGLSVFFLKENFFYFFFFVLALYPLLLVIRIVCYLSRFLLMKNWFFCETESSSIWSYLTDDLHSACPLYSLLFVLIFSHSCLLNSRYGDKLRSTKWEKLKWGSAFHFIAGFATLWGQVRRQVREFAFQFRKSYRLSHIVDRDCILNSLNFMLA